MKNKRPVNLDLIKFRFPLPAVASILHRISGVGLFLLIPLLLWLLERSLASPEGYAELRVTLAQPLWKLILLVTLAALLYHLVAGIRHLLMDLHIGDTLAGARLGARSVLAASTLLVALLGVWIW